MGFYAQYNRERLQMIGVPQNLPTQWKTISGADISNFHLLSKSVLRELGWVPVVYEDLPNAEAYYSSSSPTWDAENSQFIFEAVATDLDEA